MKCCEDCTYFHVEEYIDVEYNADGEPQQVRERRCYCYALPPVIVNEIGPRWNRPEVSGGDPACRYFEDQRAEERMYRE